MYRDKQINLALLYVGAQSFANARFGRGTGPLLLDRIRCTGREQYLLNCSHSGVGVTSYYCGHDDDAGVRCQGNLPMLFLLKVTICRSVTCSTQLQVETLKIMFSSFSKLYGWPNTLERWGKYEGRESRNLHQQVLGYYM